MAHAGEYEVLHRKLLKIMSSTSVILCILLTLAYTAILRLPRIFHQQVEHAKPCLWQHLFIMFNSVSFFASAGGLLLFTSSTITRLLSSSSSRGKRRLAADQAKDSTPEQRMGLEASCFSQFIYIVFCVLISLVSAGFAYIFAGLALLKLPVQPQVPVTLTCVLGGLFYIEVLLVLVAGVLRMSRECICSHPELWQASKSRLVFTSYFEYALSIDPMASSAFGVNVMA